MGGVVVAQAAVAAFNLSVSFTSASLGGALIAAGALYDSRALLDRVFFGKKDRTTPRRDLNPRTQNTANPGAPVPIVLGERRYTPYLAALPSTEEVGSGNNIDEFINVIVCWGHAAVSVRDIRLGTQLATEFDVTRHDDLNGLGNIDWLPRIDVSKLDIALGSSWVTRRTVTRSDYITVRIDSDLFAYTTRTEQRGRDEQNQTDYPIYTHYSNWRDVKVDHRKVGANTWTSKTVRIDGSGKVYITLDKGEDTTKPNGRAPLERGEYEVRVRVTGSGNDAPSNASIGGGVKWARLDSRLLEAPVTGSGIATSLFRIKVTEDTGETVDQINAIVGTKMPLRQSDGTWPDISTDAYKSDATKYGISKNPADIFRFVMTGKEINESPLSVSDIDDSVLNEWWQFCNEKALGYSKVVEGDETRQDLIGEIAKAGLAYPRQVDGKWSVAINRPVADATQMFTPRNSINFRQQIDMPIFPHALRVAFANEEKDWEADERIVYDDGFAALAGNGNAEAIHIEDLNLPGVTNKDAVFKLARHIQATARLRPYAILLDVGIEYLASHIGDKVLLQHDVALIGQASGRVKKVLNTGVIQLDEEVTFETGKPYTLIVRKANRDIVVVSVTGNGTTNSVQSNDVMGVAAGDLFAFGEFGKTAHEMIISKIEPRFGETATITLIPYSPDVFNAANVIPEWVSNLSPPISPTRTGPPPPTITDIVSDESALPITLSGSPIPTMRVDFEPSPVDPLNARVRQPRQAKIEFRPVGTDDWDSETVPASQRRGWIYPVTVAQQYEVRVRYIDVEHGISEWSDSEFHTVTGLAAAPKAVDALQIDNSGDIAVLEWVYFNPPLDVVSFEVRYAENQGVRQWNQMRRVGRLVPANARTLALPSATGTYAIKAIDAGGRESETAIYRDDSKGPLTAFADITTLTEHPAFSGTKVGLSVYNSTLQLTRSASGEEVTNPEGTYTTAITDLGGIYSVDVLMEGTIAAPTNLSNKMSDIDPMSDASSMSGATADERAEVVVEVRTATNATERDAWDDSDWDLLSTRQGVRGRYIQFRVKCSTETDTVTPVISALVFKIRAAARAEHGQATSLTNASDRIRFGAAFETTPEIALQIVNPQAGEYSMIDSSSAAEFRFCVRNSQGNRVARQVNWFAYGYGKAG